MAFDINIRDCKHTPSFITAALDGDVGMEGQRGTSLYFSNYDLSNDYYKDIVIRKLTNNVMLSSDADIKQEGREYINGDLILCTDKRIYMVKKDDDVYDIECIGILQDENITNNFKDNIINVTLNITFETLKTGTYQNNKTSISVYDDVACLKIEPRIYTLKDDNDNNEYEYFLRIHLYNKKYMHGNEYSLKYEDKIEPDNPFGLSLTDKYIEFYKKIEFELCNVQENVQENDNYESMYDIIIPTTAMDLLHPSGNNIAFHYDTNSEYSIIKEDKEYICIESGIYIVEPNDIDDVGIADFNNIVQLESNIVDNRVCYNVMAGDSCYFSGLSMTTENVNNFSDYTNNAQLPFDEKCKEMFLFLTSDKNKIEIVCVNKETRRVEIIDTKNSDIKCKFILREEDE